MEKLAAIGIANTSDLITATRAGAAQVATRAGLDLPLVDDVTQLSRFCLITGIGPIRSRLYRDAVGSVEQLAGFTADELITVTTRHIAETGFSGIPPTPKEARFTVDQARLLVMR